MTRVTLGKRPGAGNPPARICEGESRMAELLDRDPDLRMFDAAPSSLAPYLLDCPQTRKGRGWNWLKDEGS